MSARVAARVAAGTYVAAWLVGLVAAPARPTSDSALRTYFLEHAGAAVVQALLVHGLAALALAAFAWSLGRLVASRAWRLPLAGALVAATLSLAQVAILLSIVGGADTSAAETTAVRAGWIDSVDAIKLLALAVFIVLGTAALARRGAVPPWLRPLSWALAAFLLMGAASFAASSPLLTGTLYVALPLLLVWVGAVGLTARASRPDNPHRAAHGDQFDRRRDEGVPGQRP